VRINYNYIKIIGLLILIGGLFAFSNHRNSNRKVAESHIKFLGENKLFITDATVSKLLIQNLQPVTEQHKYFIDLN
jgi:cell division protein FtsQ